MPGAIFEALPNYHTIHLGLGAIQIELSEGKKVLGRGARSAIDRGSAGRDGRRARLPTTSPTRSAAPRIADVCNHDGDFAVRRPSDGSFELRLLALRARESGIAPSLLLLYLVQLMAYEDWSVDGDLVGLPVLLGNPSLAFEGVVRGLRYRYRDLGQPEEQAARQAERLDFRLWALARRPRLPSLGGALPRGASSALVWRRSARAAGGDSMPMQTKLGLLELAGRRDPASTEARSARTLKAFLERISREIGRIPEDDPELLRSTSSGVVAYSGY